MQIRRSGWSETWRVLAYTLAVALAFIGLGRLQLALFSAPETSDLLISLGLIDPNPDAKLQQQAAQVAEQSRDALARLPPGHRLATVRLGYEVGFASQLTGAFAMSAADVQAKARTLAAPHVAAAHELAGLLGVAPVEPLPVGSLKQFTELNDRFERDENGVAARVEQQLSPQHRHLYLLGVHLGTESARVEASGGQFAQPPASLIRRHATLADVAPALWQPLATAPRDETPEQVQARYRAALNALGNGLAQDAGRP